MKTGLLIFVLFVLMNGACLANEHAPSHLVSIKYLHLVDFSCDGKNDSVFVLISGDSMYDTFTVTYSVVAGWDTLFHEEYTDTLFERIWDRTLNRDEQEYLKVKTRYYWVEMARHCYHYGVHPSSGIFETQSEKYLARGTPWEENKKIHAWFEDKKKDPNLPVLVIRLNPQIFYSYVYIPYINRFVRIN